jgi:REP element-mobilizing transposase RayT
MVAGYHLIWTAYGWWLPNDPRGSSSHEIRVEQIASLGELHHGRKLEQPLPRELREFYEEAQRVLEHDLLTFDEQDRLVIAASLAIIIQQRGYTCYACAVMPDHVHALIRRHNDWAEQMIDAFQDASREALKGVCRRPLPHPVWGGKGWTVYQNTRQQMERTIRYIEQNPIKAHLPPQRWGFVRPYDGWLPHPNR